MRAISNRMKAIKKAVDLKAPDSISISVSWRNDGLVEWDLPNGETELITEAEYKARGGILVRWVDELITKQTN